MSLSTPADLSRGSRRAARVLIIDNQPIVREGLRRIIENEDDLLVCAEADTLKGARAAIREANPDVIIADISLNEGDCLGLVREVRAHYPHLRILVLSIHDETIYAERILSFGANGYVTKQATREQILYSLRRVIGGGISVSEAVASNMIRGAYAKGKRKSANPIDRLSNRELQVLHSVGQGMSTRETAHCLCLSIKTIESHRQRIKAKLNLRSGVQAHAVRHQLVHRGERRCNVAHQSG
jgi:DNA-binding NarL/FixJ family response regulator